MNIKYTCLMLVILFVCSAVAQESIGLTKEEMEDNLKLQEALLKLKESKEERDKYQREYNMNLEFYKSGIVTLKELNDSEQDLESAKLTYERAMIDLEKTRLGFLSDATRIEITGAKKYLTEDGDRKASIQLRNASDLKKALASDPSLKEADVRDLLCIKQLKVYLESDAIISSPYEKIIESMKVGEEVTIDFNLLQDVQKVYVNMEYGSSTIRKNVFLRKESLRDIPTIETSQDSQQGELGSVVTYAIELERLSEEDRRFNLLILGLPRYFTAAFKQKSATVTNIKFTDKISVVNVDLEIVIPEKFDREKIDLQQEFFVVVTKPSQAKSFNDLNTAYYDEGREITADALDKLQCNYMRLDLTPTGKGELEISIENSYKEVKVGEKADFRFFVRNTGTLEIRNISIKNTPPFKWTVTAEPERIDSIAPDSEVTVTIKAEHSSDSAVGEYEVRVKATGEAGYEEIEAEEKNFSVKLIPKAKLMQNLILISVLVAVVVIISIVSIVVSRR